MLFFKSKMRKSTSYVAGPEPPGSSAPQGLSFRKQRPKQLESYLFREQTCEQRGWVIEEGSKKLPFGRERHRAQPDGTFWNR